MDISKRIDRSADRRIQRRLGSSGQEFRIRRFSSPAAKHGQSDLYARIRFKVAAPLPTGVTLLSFQTNDGGGVASLLITVDGTLAVRNGVTGVTTDSGVKVVTSDWHEAQIHINAISGVIEVWLDVTA